MAARRRFARSVYDIERLAQAQADLDRSLGLYYTECLRQATETTNDVSAEWMRKAEQTEQFRHWALTDFNAWITELSSANHG